MTSCSQNQAYQHLIWVSIICLSLYIQQAVSCAIQQHSKPARLTLLCGPILTFPHADSNNGCKLHIMDMNKVKASIPRESNQFFLN